VRERSVRQQKSGPSPAAFKLSLSDARAERGSTRAKNKKQSYFFFAFLAFFAFFAFFAFLAIVSSQGLMVKRDTRDARRRASLATSSMPNSADSRAAAPRCHATVIALSTAQTLFREILVRESALRAGVPTWLTIPESAGRVHQSKTKAAISKIPVRLR
jgi:hypothetical protein